MSENCTHDCSSCGENCSSRSHDPADFIEKLNPKSRVNKTIGIVSGKGGVGKSLVTSLLAVTARRAGKKTPCPPSAAPRRCGAARGGSPPAG